MSPRARVVALTSVIALVSAGIVVAIAARSGGEPPPQAEVEPRAGAPPLALDLGVRTDSEARDLRKALGLYSAGKRVEAAAIFARHHSLEAKVGRELAEWPTGTVAGLSRLAALYPKSALVQLELGLTVYWARETGAADAWRQAAALEPDTSYAVTAGNLLYPQYARNLPTFIPAESPPASLEGKSPAAQLASLRRNAMTGPASAKLIYGVALQKLGHPLSARQVFDAAARQAPDDPETLVASAVGRFDKADPAAAFSRLGPLARRFPSSSSVRFHLGLLLLWIGSVDQAKKELRLATTAQPGSRLAREAARYLTTLEQVDRK